jgi:hypothetical protein
MMVWPPSPGGSNRTFKIRDMRTPNNRVPPSQPFFEVVYEKCSGRRLSTLRV